MPNILAIDTSSEFCSVSLNCDGQVQTKISTKVRHHALELLPMVEQLLQENSLTVAQLHAIAVVVGPGSFTGVRIGTGVAQGLAFGAQLPVIGVSSLAVMAMEAFLNHGANQCFVALCARENEIYGASYRMDAGCPILVGKEFVGDTERCRFASFSDNGDIAGVGSGWAYESILRKNACYQQPQAVYTDLNCESKALSVLAMKLLELGRGMSPEQVLPVYVKDEMDYKA
jgi:tRNA threonylcarbamoyladenosine biosynthesis protein TsaB